METTQTLETTPIVENTTAAVETPASTPNETVVPTFDTYVPEEYRERFKQPEEVFNYIRDIESKANQKEEYSDLLQRAIEIEKGGTKLSLSLLQEAAKDYNSYKTDSKDDGIYLVKEAMRRDYPELTSAEIDRKVAKKYGNLFVEDPESEEYQDALTDLKIEAKSARAKLIEQQSKIVLPKEATMPNKQAPQIDPALLMQEIDKSMQTLSKLPLQVDEETTLDFEPSPETVKRVKTMMATPDKLFSRWIGEGGKLDYSKLGKDLIILEEMQNIQKATSSQLKAKYKEETIKSQSNIQLPNSSPTNSGTPAPVNETSAKIQEQIKKFLGTT